MCQGERDVLVNWGLDLSFSLKYITKSLRQQDRKTVEETMRNTCRYMHTTDTTFLPHHYVANGVENQKNLCNDLV